MEDTMKTTPTNGGKKAMVKASILVVFIVVAIYMIKFTPVKNYLTGKPLVTF